MRILLVQPEYKVPNFGFRLAAMPEPLHLEILAGAAPGHEYRVLDMRLDDDLLAVLEAFGPDVVAVTALTTEVYAARDVLATVKGFNEGIFTVVGGHHATLMPEDFMCPEVDAIALGEGEFAFPKLTEAVAARQRDLSAVPNIIWRDGEGEFRATERQWPTARSMDELALPRRDLVSQYRPEYFFLFDKPDSSVASSRGCPFHCNFCSVHEFFAGKTRQMSVDRLMKEIHQVDTPHITFVDDNFLMNVKRESALADRIKAEGLDMTFSMESRTDTIAKHPELVEKWVDIGLYAVLLGLEGATQDSLTNVNKSNRIEVNDRAIEILKDLGVIVWGAFIADPGWEADDFKRLRDYVNAREITHTQFTVLTPLPGTQLYRQMQDQLLTNDYTCYDTLHAVTPTKLPREEFYQHFANLYKQTDLGPYMDLVRSGKLSIDDVKRGKAIFDGMSNWENYLVNDPVLGQTRTDAETLPGARLRAQREAMGKS